ncbi:leucine-rich repeat and death domain-containing protein 1-like [Melanaphis sacchari]|uniref:leucine-rich repeat and death domain-containing protein 1-like n=1 Tax=Melanaphis sacchari TaxID=742174 RepID=UPI000DC14240|nr:leucine-rich repeat and death domain-containing protein 1-like [Melanaphis sacchari]
MISITGYVFLNDKTSERRYGTRVNHTIVEINDVNGTYTVFIKMSSNQVESSYMLENLDGVLYHEMKIVLLFREPSHELLILSDDVNRVKIFYKNLMSLAKSLNLKICKSFKTDIFNIFGIINSRDLFQNLKLNNLRTIALENCDLPYIPAELGNLKISSLSLNGSKLNMPDCGENFAWDWMTMDNISKTLNVLEINSIGLMKLPYEVMYLKNLRSLSVSNNNLKYLPHFVGELSDLQFLYVDGNNLICLPDSLLDKVFRRLNILNNNFNNFNDFYYFKERSKNECSGVLKVPTLLDLSFLCIMDNCVKFKRHTIPHNLWTCANLIGRCRHCKKLMIFDRNYRQFIFAAPNTTTIPVEGIYWQYFKCRPPCT